MNSYENKALIFAMLLQSAYDDEDRQVIDKIEFSEDFTEDMTAMLQALHIIYVQLIGDDLDFIGFTHLLNRLAIQYAYAKEEE